ncbi:PaaI family thioesterase [Acidiplasma aeolicum]|uniref:Esterase n=2 Tax=Acidiplasma aeolicum TaxID=507754 RepID=A0A0Q0RWY0_9ARCH|nr:PaaI family thioesterase [Acidiplasma aeolicum]KQB34411.1 esterase [Acidiplasma aeolicum]
MPGRIEKAMNLAGNLKALNELFSADKVFSYLGLEITKVEEGHCEMSMPYSERITRAGMVLNGGMMMAAADFIGGLTAMTVNNGSDQVTQELKINFLNPMHRGPFRLVSDVIKAGHKSVVIEIKLYDADGTMGIIGLGTWYIIHDRIIKKD